MTRTNTARKVLALLTAVLMVTSVMGPAVAYSLPANDGPTTPDSEVGTNDTGGGLKAQSSHVTNVTSCTEISESGQYRLTRDIITTIDRFDCIRITASDVTLDGNGHRIKYNSSIFDSSAGVRVGSGVSNVTVHSMTIRYFQYGVDFVNASDSEAHNLTINHNVSVAFPPTDRFGNPISTAESAVWIRDGSSNVTVRNSFFGQSGKELEKPTVYVVDSNDTTIRDNRIFDPGSIGVRLLANPGSGTSNTRIVGNTIEGSRPRTDGILVGDWTSDTVIRDNEIDGRSSSSFSAMFDGIKSDGSNNTVVDNDVHDLHGTGIEVDGFNTSVRGNYVHDNLGLVTATDASGVEITSTSSGATLTNNVISGNDNADGVYVDSNGTTITDNVIQYNDEYGLHYSGVTDATARNNTLIDNFGADLWLTNSGPLTFEELSFRAASTLEDPTNVTFTGENVGISAVSDGFAPDDLAANDSIGHYLNVTNTGSSAISSFELRYGDAEAANVTESDLSVFAHDGTNWNEIPGLNAVDPANNTISNTNTVTLPDSRVIAPFAPDVTTPSIQGLTTTNESGDLRVAFDASEELTDIEVTVENSSGTVLTLTEADMQRGISLFGFRYVNTSDVLDPGAYTVTIRKATDDGGNDGASGQNQSVELSVALSVESISITGPAGANSVQDGDEVSVSVTPNGTNIQSVTVNASEFGASSSLSLADGDSDGTYNGTFTADLPTEAFGTGSVDVTVTDGQGQTASTTSGTLLLDAALEIVGSPSITDRTNGDGNVTTGDVVGVTVEVDGENVTSVVANASNFDGPDAVSLSDGNGNGTYTGNFTVGTDVPAGVSQSVEVTISDNESRSVTSSSLPIDVDVSAPFLSEPIGSDALNVSRVDDGDVVQIDVRTFDFELDLDSVVANASAFGGPDVVVLQQNTSETYTGTFTVDAANARDNGTYDIPVTATDTVGLSETLNLSLELGGSGPAIDDATVRNIDGPDDEVRDGDRINVTANVSDADDVIGAYVNASAFGRDRIGLAEISPGVYSATFGVKGSDAADNGNHSVEIVVNYSSGATVTESTNELTLDLQANVEFLSASPYVSNTGATDGTTLEATVTIRDFGTPVSLVTMDASPLGAGEITLTEYDRDDDLDIVDYNATYTVNASRADPDGEYRLRVEIIDDDGISLTRNTTDTITLDTTPPHSRNATAIDLEDGDGVVSDGDRVEVTAAVTDDGSGVERADAFPDSFGVAGPLPMTDADGDGVYDTTFRVEADRASPDGSYTIGLGAIDEAGNVNLGRVVTNELELDTSPEDQGEDGTPPTTTSAVAVSRVGGDSLTMPFTGPVVTESGNDGRVPTASS